MFQNNASGDAAASRSSDEGVEAIQELRSICKRSELRDAAACTFDVDSRMQDEERLGIIDVSRTPGDGLEDAVRA